MSYKLRVSLIGIGMAMCMAWSASAGSVLYVSSFDNDRVLKFDADTGAFLGVFVTAGSGGLNGPTGLTFGPDGHLYVASFVFNNTVFKYHGTTGQFLGVFVTEGSGGLRGPIDISFGPDGKLYVVASYEGGVFRYDGTTGAFLDRFTIEPTGAEAIRFRKGSVFVSSHMTDNVHHYNSDTGAFVGTMVEGFLDWATGFDIGPDNSLYVASFFDDSVMKYSKSGEWLGTFATNCFGPQMIEFGPNGDLYVASYFGDSVDVFNGQTGAWKRSMYGFGLSGAMDVAFQVTTRHPRQ